MRDWLSVLPGNRGQTGFTLSIPSTGVFESKLNQYWLAINFVHGRACHDYPVITTLVLSMIGFCQVDLNSQFSE